MNKLDEAKINLKSVLERLEKSVELNLKEKKGTLASEVSGKMKEIEQENVKLLTQIKDKSEEIEYLRENNSKLQAQLGEMQQENINLNDKNKKAIKKVDTIIGEVKSYMMNNEMF